ncbi:hypothetical protein OQJ15_10630 [Fluoribacter dumoffii]|uniref:hypothetical protein n=1 Tax=Fluoribacter dumoffii TaxID=463 RepID=UPI0022433B4A|nr:hypothetical protein [Fluoribacter dumoffii]MCW8386763.1 hypothetical protein [Fluoribacter dumoffii]
MLKAICSIGLLEMMLVLTGCAPTAYVVGTVNQPIKYTYAPPQAAYPDVPVDANTSIDTPAIVQQENAINEMNDTMAIVQQQNQAAQQQAIEQQLNAMTLLH